MFSSRINLLSARCECPNSLISTLFLSFPLSLFFFLIRTIPWFIECLRHNILLTVTPARTKYSSVVFSTPNRTRRKRVRRSASPRLLFGENYPRTAKHIHLRFSTECSTSGANKSRANKTVAASRTASRGGNPPRRGGDPNSCAREQILEPDALARAARVKTRVRIQLKSPTADGSRRAGFFFLPPRDRNVWARLPLMHARQAWYESFKMHVSDCSSDALELTCETKFEFPQVYSSR